MAKTICIATARNHPGRHDGDEFVREMIRFSRFYEDAACYKLQTQNRHALRSETDKIIKMHDGEFSAVAIFGHGSWKWVFGTGHHVWNITELADAIVQHCNPPKPPTIILYSCSCGNGRYPLGRRRPVVERQKILGRHGVAHRLSAELGVLGERAKVFAHTARGHTTKNPLLCMITTDPATLITTTVYYREYIKQELGRPGWRKFCALMRHHPTFRYDVQHMTMGEVLAVLDTAPSGRAWRMRRGSR